MKIGAVIDDQKVVQGLAVEAPEQLPYIAAATLTALAGDARHDLQQRMTEVFDQPVDFTLRGVFTRRASRSELTSEVFIPDSQESGGKGAREYMRPSVYRTYMRQQKKTEFLLSRMGALPRGWVTVPGKGAQRDSHGNIPGSIYKQIINVLQLKTQALGPGFRGVAERSKKQAARLGVQSIYFVAAPGNRLGKGGGRLPPGVWKHTGKHAIALILKFVPRAGYKTRLDIEAEAQGTVKRQLALRFREAAIAVNARFLAGRR